MRSSQLDAGRLDTELFSLLGEQLGRVLALFNPVRTRMSACAWAERWHQCLCLAPGLKGGWPERWLA